MYEGAPNHPREDRFWEIIEKYRVTIFYTAPTAIRAFIKWGDQWPQEHDLSSLRLLGTVGEPINPEAWMWYHEVIGGGRCPIVDTWWQTETGHDHDLRRCPAPSPTKPGSATRPLPGVGRRHRRQAGPIAAGQPGRLAGDPAALAGDAADHLRRRRALPAAVLEPGAALLLHRRRRPPRRGRLLLDHGPGGRRAERAGHRLSTMEVESALVHHPKVAEAAVVGQPDEIKGEGIACFVTLRERHRRRREALKKELREHVAKEIGALARPDEIRFTDALPKTRSGKIMRRLLRDIASGQADDRRHDDAGGLQRAGEAARGRGGVEPDVPGPGWPAGGIRLRWQ